jgi:BspA type Leucine rich repeat region (6 copies)
MLLMKEIFVVFLSLFLLSVLTAQAQFTFTTNADNTLTLNHYSGLGGLVTIPTNNNGLTVTSIGSNAFGFSSVSSVTIPNTITNIGFDAFNECFLLGSVTIGSNVLSIGEGAFNSCGNLSFITIPNSVTSIGEGAFADTGLRFVTIPKSVTNLGGNPFPDTLLQSIGVDTNNPAFTNVGGRAV